MSLYVKESTLKLFPKLEKDILEVLFADCGFIPSRSQNGKMKSCHIVVNYAGVHFYRPLSLSTSYKKSFFLPIISITGIKYNDERRRTLITTNPDKKEVEFECPHIEKCIGMLISARTVVYYGCTKSQPLEFIDFPEEPRPEAINEVKDYSALKYLISCAVNNDKVDEQTKKAFSSLDGINCNSITFDSKCQSPKRFQTLIHPFFLLTNVKKVQFENFSPFLVCRIAHFLLKHTNVDTIVFKDYNNLIPEQLRLRNVNPNKLLSFGFINCTLNQRKVEALFDVLSEFNGDFHRLVIDGFALSLKGWNIMISSLTKGRPYRTLEYLNLDGIDCPEMTNELLDNDLEALFRHLRFIMRFSISNWPNPIAIGTKFFSNSSTLSDIVIRKQTMYEPLPETFRFPSLIYTIDFSNSYFAHDSLIALFKIIGKIGAKNPISLNLSDIIMANEEWDLFYKKLPNIERLRNIRELFWNGNPLNKVTIGAFTKFFFETNKIVFLSIDRVFSSSMYLAQFLDCFKTDSLWGLSLCGNDETNFEDNNHEVIPLLEKLGNLHFLHYDNQHINDKDSECLINYIKNQKGLVELSCDGTLISNNKTFYRLYSAINKSQIQSIGRPVKDIQRILGPNIEQLSESKHYQKFSQGMQQKLFPMSPIARAFYICKFDLGDKLDTTRYNLISQKYPTVLDDIFENPLSKSYPPKQIQRFPSLNVFRIKTPAKTLGDIHAKFLIEPTKIPRYRATQKHNLPSCFTEPQPHYSTPGLHLSGNEENEEIVSSIHEEKNVHSSDQQQEKQSQEHEEIYLEEDENENASNDKSGSNETAKGSISPQSSYTSEGNLTSLGRITTSNSQGSALLIDKGLGSPSISMTDSYGEIPQLSQVAPFQTFEPLAPEAPAESLAPIVPVELAGSLSNGSMPTLIGYENDSALGVDSINNQALPSIAARDIKGGHHTKRRRSIRKRTASLPLGSSAENLGVPNF